MKQREVRKELTTADRLARLPAPALPHHQPRVPEPKGAWTGPARLQLLEHALAPLADFPVREIVSDSHLLTDQTLARAKRCHDYLDNTR